MKSTRSFLRRPLLAALLTFSCLTMIRTFAGVFSTPPAVAQTTAGTTTVQITNKAGAALAIGNLVRSNNTSAQVTRAQADSAADAAGPLLVMVTSAADNGAGYASQLPAWVLFSDSPTAGSTAYLDAANAGKATITAPASGGSRQLRVLGNILKVSGSLGLVVGSTDNAASAAGSTSGAVTYGTGLTYSSGTSTVTSNVSTGVSGGQTITGGTAASNSLTLRSTSNSTKGTTILGTTSDVIVDEVNHRLGIGGTPTAALHIVSGSLKLDGTLATGLLKHTTSTGALTIGAATTDYPDPAATFIVKTSTAAPTNAQVLASLSTGLVKVTATTGALTTATAGSDYENPLTFASGVTRTTNAIANDLITGKSGGQTVIGDTAASGNLTLQGTSNGTAGTVIVAGPTFKVSNTANTGTDHAWGESAVNSIAAGDPHYRYTIPSGTSWYTGVDNSNSDAFDIGTSTAVGSARYFEINSGSNAVIRFGPDISGQTIITAGSQPHQILTITTGGANPTFNVGTDTASTLVLRTNNAARETIDANGNVVIGDLSTTLSTSATNGFLYIPTCAGTPSGTPTTRTGTVPLIFDTTNNKLYIYTAGAWKGGTVPGAFL